MIETIIRETKSTPATKTTKMVVAVVVVDAADKMKRGFIMVVSLALATLLVLAAGITQHATGTSRGDPSIRPTSPTTTDRQLYESDTRHYESQSRNYAPTRRPGG